MTELLASYRTETSTFIFNIYINLLCTLINCAEIQLAGKQLFLSLDAFGQTCHFIAGALGNFLKTGTCRTSR